MAIYGIGVDLCDISRIESSLEKFGEKFAEKILHPQELVAFQNHKMKAHFVAKRFAAKEAFSKAMGTGISGDLTMPSIEVVNDAQGKPVILLHAGAQAVFSALGAAAIHLSLSDEKNYAIAHVVIEKHS